MKPLEWRAELFFKNAGDLGQQVRFLQRQGITRMNLPNKKSEDDLLEAVKVIREACPQVHLCVHYSLKYNYLRNIQEGHQRFLRFCRALQEELPRSCVLLVSGGGKKKRLDTVACLEMTDRGAFPSGLGVYVAFNPYLGGLEQEQERARLARKLASKLVRGVYLQMGTDVDQLQAGIAFLRQAQPVGTKVEVLGSVFLPTPRLLAQMRYRPWSGVFLSEEYLSSVEAAGKITQHLLDIYSSQGVTPLVESPINSDREYEAVCGLLTIQEL